MARKKKVDANTVPEVSTTPAPKKVYAPFEAKNVKMWLLHNDSIIISETLLNSSEGVITLDCPALVFTKRTTYGAVGMQLVPWIPTELMADTQVHLNHVQCISSELVPKKELVAFYLSWRECEYEKLARLDVHFSRQLNQLREDHDKMFSESIEAYATNQAANNASQLAVALDQMFSESDDWGPSNLTN